MLSVNFKKTAALINQNTFPFSMPVKWQDASSADKLPLNIQDWLLNTGSLTERLQALTSTFEVNLLGQAPAEMDESESQLLKPSPPQTWQVREVVLRGSAKVKPQAGQHIESNNQANSKASTNLPSQQQDWVFARSVLPNELCQSAWRNLGNQPLGQRIFNDPSFVRSEFEIGRLLYHPVTGADFSANNYWARRSKFKIDKFELIVAEAFLPMSPCYW
jgi:chorismate--pyruvate lyase